ncbi:Terpenoid cyclases/protein prenyltransferase alpha-alpha toroid [Amanita muscaria]
MTEPFDALHLLSKTSHAAHCRRCLTGLPAVSTDLDASRLVIAFYCIGSLDLLGRLYDKISDAEREAWREWIWDQYTLGGVHGSGFRPSPYMKVENPSEHSVQYDASHMIMTYAAIITLAVLRDDFERLDRPSLIQSLRSCQREDGSFSTTPGGGETDLRTLYCAFAISTMLDDWSGINVPRAVDFIAKCRSYEGGYGQAPFCEAQGGTTYIAIAALHLIPERLRNGAEVVTPAERAQTIRWLVQNQEPSGGFRGRTGKEADACYCFWCSAALQILGARELVNVPALLQFISDCQFRFGGIAKSPGGPADPYHTYLALAAVSMYPPDNGEVEARIGSWKLPRLDPLLNTSEETSDWARKHVRARVE